MGIKQVQLKADNILKVHLGTYEQDFSFFVNGKEFKTSRVTSDLLSSKINEIHLVDPTFNLFTINTRNEGNFDHVLKLVEFKDLSISDSELPFFIEVIEILNPYYIEYKHDDDNIEISLDNVFSILKEHQKFCSFYCSQIEREISFISNHFFELYMTHEEELNSLDEETIIRIISNKSLKLTDEDQLLKFCIEHYKNDRQTYSIFDFIQFEYVSCQMMNDFIDVYNINDMTINAWHKLCERLKHEIKSDQKSIEKNDRYTKNTVSFSEENVFSGIINHLMNKTSGKIENEINITASSINSNQEKVQPRNIFLFNDQSKFFCSNNEQPSWICIDFKDHQVYATGYTIKTSVDGYANGHQPRNWFIEGSNDKENCDILDEEKDCNFLQGKDSPHIHTFKMNHQNQKKYRYIRMKQTQNWYGDNHLFIDSFEIYGEYF